jgi:yersiniabactin nonribosomal peptide synthetase
VTMASTANSDFTVVRNDEEQYSIWPAGQDVPPGWAEAGKRGPEGECLAYIDQVWTDLRPLSLRRALEEPPAGFEVPPAGPEEPPARPGETSAGPAPAVLVPPAGGPGQHCELTLPAGLAAAADQLAAAAGATASAVWLAALALLLHRYTGDAVVAVAGTDPGCHPVSLDFASEPSFRDCVGRAASALRGPGGPAAWPGSFGAAGHPAPPHPLTGMTLAVTSADDAAPAGAGSSLRVDYDPALAGAADAERAGRHYLAVLGAALRDPDRPAGLLELLGEPERGQLLTELNATTLAFDPARSLAVRVAEVAAATPRQLALSGPDGELSYGELDERAARLAQHLAAAGLVPGSRAAVLLERSAEFVVALVAVLKSGAAAVPLDPKHPDASLAAVLADADARVVITRAVLLPRMPSAAASRAVCLDRDADAIAGQPAVPLSLSPAPDEVGIVFYTSGSTGEPKGVMIRHETIANLIEATRAAYGVTPADRTSWLSSPAFAIAAQEWIAFLGLGATVCVAGPEVLSSSELIRDWLIAAGVTCSVLVAPVAERLWALPWPPAPPLRLMLATGAAVRHPARAGLPFETAVFYATTETLVTASCLDAQSGLHASAANPGAGDAGRPLPVGRPTANSRVYILDAAQHPVPVGVVGELYVAGSGLAAGYLGRPDLTAQRFVRSFLDEEPGGRLYRTGDLARHRPDGLIEVIGRADDAVKIRGYRVEPAAVEIALAALPSVREAAVVARPDAGGDDRLVAYVVAAGPPCDAAGLRSALAARLPAYLVPDIFIPLDDLPRLISGKLDRAALPAPAAAGGAPAAPARSAPAAPARSAREAAVAGQWRRLLGSPDVAATDDFFALGGHSLAAMDLISWLNSEYGAGLTLGDLHDAPTVAGLAALLDARCPAGAHPGSDDARQAAAPARRVPGAASPDTAGPDTAGPGVVRPDPGAAHDPFPLTDAQYAYWVGRGDAVELGNVGCHGYFEWQGADLDPERLGRAWQRLIDRHDALRLVIQPDGTQRVRPLPAPYRPPVLDLREHDGEAARQAVAAVRGRLSHQVLPADRWPLFDLRITLLPGGQVRLHLSFDLLIMDAWSYAQLLIPELARFYADPDAEAEPLALTFRDYVVATRAAQPESPDYVRSRAYWRGRLDRLPPAPDLPSAGGPAASGPAAARSRFRRRAARLDAAAWTILQERARARGVTRDCFLIATFAEILRTWSGSTAFTLNCPLFNRQRLHPQVDEVVGDFTTTSLLSVEKADGTFAERARSIQRQMWDDLEHRHFNGIEVLRELARAAGGSARRAAFPVVVTSMLGQPSRPAATALGEAIYGISQTPQVSLDFQIWPDDGTGDLQYNWDSLDELFPAGLLDDMFEAHRGLLHQLGADEQAWSADRLILTPGHQLALRQRVNDTAAPLPVRLLHAALGELADSQPELPAVITPDRCLTYRELYRRASQVGRRLRALGARPNQLVAIVMEKGWPQIVACYGVLAAGAAYLPIDPAVPPERLRRLLELGEVSIVLTRSADHRGVTAWPAGVRGLDVDTDFDTEDDAPLPAAQDPSDLAYVIFTSGSTGVPKGVMVDHRGALNTILDVNGRFGIGPRDRAIAISGLHFDLSVYDVFGPINAGGAVVVPDSSASPDPARWASLMEQAEVTIWNSVPAMLEMLVTHLDASAAAARVRQLSRLRLVVLAGDWIPLSLPGRLQALNPAAQFIASGGPAETCIWSIIYPVTEVDPAWSSIPYGRPMANQRYHVLDQQLRPRPTWVPGEIHTASEVGLARGYWRDEERTARQFITLPETGERAYATGDLGRYLPDGSIEILGRADFQVKIQGVRIEPGEVEAAIRQFPGVRAAVVVADGASRDLAVLHAYVTWAAGEDPDRAGENRGRAEELRAFLIGELPAALVPPRITSLADLPLTRNGKVDRLALARTSAPGPRPGSEPEGDPVTPLDRVVGQVVAELLGLPEIGAQDDFFALGGNSLSASALVSQLRELLGAAIPLHRVFAAPTAAGICAAALADPATRPAVLAMATELDRLAGWPTEQAAQAEGR